MLIDAHCHLDEDYVTDLPGVLSRARAAGVDRLIANGLWRSEASFGRALQLSREHPSTIAATVGIHPHDCAQVGADDYALCQTLAADPKVVAVGETGLDFHYNHSPPERQREALRWSIALARTVKKPLVVHVREADAEAARILRDERAFEIGGQIHCFSGDVTAARAYLDLGFHLSVSGIVTFKTAGAIREAVRDAPIDRLLVETDTPFLAPVPYRGKRNEPAYVVETARAVAAVKAVSLEEIARATTENATVLFRLCQL